jgi:hypothetical protein
MNGYQDIGKLLAGIGGGNPYQLKANDMAARSDAILQRAKLLDMKSQAQSGLYDSYVHNGVNPLYARVLSNLVIGGHNAYQSAAARTETEKRPLELSKSEAQIKAILALAGQRNASGGYSNAAAERIRTLTPGEKMVNQARAARLNRNVVGKSPSTTHRKGSSHTLSTADLLKLFQMKDILTGKKIFDPKSASSFYAWLNGKPATMGNFIKWKGTTSLAPTNAAPSTTLSPQNDPVGLWDILHPKKP